MRYINPAKQCDICSKDFDNVMYDAKTRQGPWANMCQACFDQYAIGLGVGLGQKYIKQEDGWYKDGTVSASD